MRLPSRTPSSDLGPCSAGPAPRRPFASSPQQRTPPSSNSAHVCSKPAEMCTTRRAAACVSAGGRASAGTSRSPPRSRFSTVSRVPAPVHVTSASPSAPATITIPRLMPV